MVSILSKLLRITFIRQPFRHDATVLQDYLIILLKPVVLFIYFLTDGLIHE